MVQQIICGKYILFIAKVYYKKKEKVRGTFISDNIRYNRGAKQYPKTAFKAGQYSEIQPALTLINP
jgi:hypothetical protein